jgi:hypothetical protein
MGLLVAARRIGARFGRDTHNWSGVPPPLNHAPSLTTNGRHMPGLASGCRAARYVLMVLDVAERSDVLDVSGPSAT